MNKSTIISPTKVTAFAPTGAPIATDGGTATDGGAAAAQGWQRLDHALQTNQASWNGSREGHRIEATGVGKGGAQMGRTGHQRFLREAGGLLTGRPRELRPLPVRMQVLNVLGLLPLARPSLPACNLQIVYLDLALDIRGLDPSLLPLVPLFCS